MVGDEGGYAARGRGIATARQRVSALCLGPVGESVAKTSRQRRLHSRPLRGRHAGTDVQLKGCESPGPNRPFGDLAGGRVGGVSRRLK